VSRQPARDGLLRFAQPMATLRSPQLNDQRPIGSTSWIFWEHSDEMTGNILARQWHTRLGTSTDEAIRLPIQIVALYPPGSTTSPDLPTIFYRHDQNRVVGECFALHHGREGQLCVSATITDPVAACDGLSVGATVHKYEIVDAHLPSYHALITNCHVDEISCTPNPSNFDSRVTSRWPPSGFVKRLDLIQRGVSVIAKVAEAIAHQG
jgi:hypothetical protein